MCVYYILIYNKCMYKDETTVVIYKNTISQITLHYTTNKRL